MSPWNWHTAPNQEGLFLQHCRTSPGSQEFTPGPVVAASEDPQSCPSPRTWQGMSGALLIQNLPFGTSPGPSLCCGWFCMCEVRPGRNVSVIQPSLSRSGQQASPSAQGCTSPRLVQPLCCLNSSTRAGGAQQRWSLLHPLVHQHPQSAQCLRR